MAANSKLLPASTTLPLTSNLLNSRQRKRLLRSARKLGTVLGTTPLVTGPCDHQNNNADDIHGKVFSSTTSSTLSPVKGSSQTSSICSRPDSHPCRNSSLRSVESGHNDSYSFTSSTNSLVLPSIAQNGEAKSLDSIEGERGVPRLKKMRSILLLGHNSASRMKQQSLPSASIVTSVSSRAQPLILRLEPRSQEYCSESPPSTPSTPNLLSQPSCAMSSPTSHGPGSPISPGSLTPTSPMFRVPTIVEIRRRQMAKLSRTLGEVVPAHLICMSTGESLRSQSPATVSSRRGRSLSVNLSAFEEFEEGSINQDQEDACREIFLAASSSITSPGLLYNSEGAAVTGVRAESPVCSTSYGEWNRKNLKEVQHQLRNLRLR